MWLQNIAWNNFYKYLWYTVASPGVNVIYFRLRWESLFVLVDGTQKLDPHEEYHPAWGPL